MLNIKTKEDLLRLIGDALPESIFLDYKSTEALKKTDGKRSELSKDVSAFANSAGGQLVYGIIEEDQKPLRIDGGVDRKDISPEWLDQVLATNISPRIDGLKIDMIPLDGDHVAYVITVPQATSRAPHQANDKKYYKRYNSINIAMEDHEIRDVFRRASAPELYLEFSLPSPVHRVIFETNNEGTPHPLSQPIEIKNLIGNRSNSPASWVVCNIFISKIFDIVSNIDFTAHSNITHDQQPVHEFRKLIGQPQHFPIFRETVFTNGSIVVRLPIQFATSQKDLLLGYALATPGYSATVFSKLRLQDQQFTIIDD